jgi:hypothetical protein
VRVNRAADTQARTAHFSSFVFIDVLNLFGDVWSGIERKKQYLQPRLQTASVGLDRSRNRVPACSGSVGIRGPRGKPRATSRSESETCRIVKSAGIGPFR